MNSNQEITDDQVETYWDELDADAQFELIREYISIKNDKPSIVFPSYAYIMTKDSQLVVFPTEESGELVIADGALRYMVEYPTFTFDHNPPFNFDGFLIGSGVGAVVALLLVILIR